MQNIYLYLCFLYQSWARGNFLAWQKQQRVKPGCKNRAATKYVATTIIRLLKRGRFVATVVAIVQGSVTLFYIYFSSYMLLSTPTKGLIVLLMRSR